MTESIKINNPGGMIAPLQNVGLFNELLERVMNRPIHLPGLATFHGPSGYGKTLSATYGAHKHKAYYIQVGESWNRMKFLNALITQLGGTIHGTIPDKVDQIIDILIDIDRPLIIDEFDYVVKKNFVELVREIHDKTNAPIILIGEERLPIKLQKWERFHNRILDWVPAQPISLEEMNVLASFNVRQVEVAPDLLAHVHRVIEGRVRRACVNLAYIEDEARKKGLSKISLKDWGDRPLFIGKASARTNGRGGRV
ncbi:ATP-binding protein [Paremcibacter congregatus]|uniref:ATP-binding protein n=1 Tax=Paremcibacter congregatus TaxID=2043170 RepID=UPI0030EF0970|tara:strand:+ start:723 stop:1484 length:762 start_codon:yes stop_codon:yes gene_type:complete